MEAQGAESFAELREGERAGEMCHRQLAPLHLCLCPCLQWPEPGLVLEMWALLLHPQIREQIYGCEQGTGCGMFCVLGSQGGLG